MSTNVGAANVGAVAAAEILVVDDDPQIVRLVRSYLEQAGFRVVTAEDGEVALHIIRTSRPDLVILDLMLPGRDGLSLTQLIRSDPALAPLPILMLTARVDDLDRILGLELGADDYVTKPIDYDLLRATVETRLNRMQRLREMPGDRSGLTALDRLALGVVLLDANGGVVHANPLAQNLSGAAGISLSGCIAASGENGRKLSALIAGLAPGKGIAPTGLRLDDGCQLMIIGMSLPAHSHHDEAFA
ncbi:MAG: response regulator, partial [Caldilineaceae bacterium]|nr:response regulator [Caldilineaceae bacterium]